MLGSLRQWGRYLLFSSVSLLHLVPRPAVAELALDAGGVPVDARLGILEDQTTLLSPTFLGRDRWAAHGVDVQLGFIQDTGRVLKGIDGESWFGGILAELQVDCDLHKLGLWSGGRLYFLGEAAALKDPSDLQTGVLGIDNIMGAHGVHLGQLWFEQKGLAERAAIRFGQVDALDVFGVLHATEDFINLELNYPGPIIYFATTSPEQSLGLMAWLQPRPAVRLDFGVFNGKHAGVFGEPLPGEEDLPDGSGLFLASQARILWSGWGRGGKAVVGGWVHTGELPAYGESTSRGASGLFALAQHDLVGSSGGWCRHAWWWATGSMMTPASVTPFTWTAATGLTFEGLGRQRPNDQFGVGVTWEATARGGCSPLQQSGSWILESYAQFRVWRGLTIQPDFQVLWDPPYGPPGGRSYVAILRIEAVF